MERTELIALRNPGSPIVEAYRNVWSTIRTAGTNMRLVEITAAVPNEGKSVFAANLAVVMAQAGKNVVLVECDFVRPMQHMLFQLENRGLFDAVSSGDGVQVFCQLTEQERLALLTAGSAILPDFLSSERFPALLERLKEAYDYILLDAPSVLVSADSLAVAACADGTVLVVESGKEKLKTVQLAKMQLIQARAHILGCVLNQVKVDSKYDEFCQLQGGVGQ